MYVVRLTPKEASPDYKAFADLKDAREWFGSAWHDDVRDLLDSAVLFNVPSESDARRAVEAVKAGRAEIIDRDHWRQLREAAERMVREFAAARADKDGESNA
jgi:hypothetical protein